MLFLLLLLPFLGGVLAALLPSNARNIEAWLAASVAVAELVLLALIWPTVSAGEVARAEIAWLPEAGLDIVIRVDGLAWVFAMLVAGIGLLVVVYARYYMSPEDPVPRFFSFFLAFMGAMLGIVLSGNLVQLVFFWELTSIFSFLLIGYWHDNAKARTGARVSLAVTAAGGLCLLGGVLIIGRIVGSYDVDAVISSGDLIRSHPLYLPSLVLVLLGALTKSAQFPFHFWLPQAMAAPTPVSAYLHSATMVKAGVFLLVLLWPVMGRTDEWLWLVGTTGLITFVLGAYLAIYQNDIKGLLAYSTISHLGLMTLLIGLDSPLALVAAIFHVMNHATFKASLFMAAGIVDHETGTRDLRRLGGLYRAMPITARLAMVAAASMAGVPLLNGFLSKEMFFAETIEIHDNSLVDQALPYLATLAGMFAVAYSLRFVLATFFGPTAKDLPREPREPPRWMRFPIELLVFICLIVGILPAITIGPLLSVAARSVLRDDTPLYDLAIWHGLTLPLAMSVVAIVGGIGLYLLLRSALQSGDGTPLGQAIRRQAAVKWITAPLSWRWSHVLEDHLGSRRLQPQISTLILFATAAAALPIYFVGLDLWANSVSDFDPTSDPVLALIWLVGTACAVGAARQAKYHRLAALVMMAAAGLATCLTFVWLSAPDLALTQLVVETVTTVLILLGLRWLPKRLEEIAIDATRAARIRRRRDLVISVVGGAGLATIAFTLMNQPHPSGSVAEYFLDRAYTEGGGTNVVNVILVDFRGFDTLGEITVLSIVALTVFALLRRFRPAPDNLDRPEQQRIAEVAQPGVIEDLTIVPALLTKLLFPVVGLVGLFLFLRGHDQPGGGFVAGLTMAVAIILQYMLGGARWVESRLTVRPLRWMGWGLLLAFGAGAGAWIFGLPFLTSLTSSVELPIFGKVTLYSVLIFDLGVLSLVLGATVLMLISLAHQTLRLHRASSRPEPIPAPPPELA